MDYMSKVEVLGHKYCVFLEEEHDSEKYVFFPAALANSPATLSNEETPQNLLWVPWKLSSFSILEALP